VVVKVGMVDRDRTSGGDHEFPVATVELGGRRPGADFMKPFQP
jgi:hypothetical protein